MHQNNGARGPTLAIKTRIRGGTETGGALEGEVVEGTAKKFKKSVGLGRGSWTTDYRKAIAFQLSEFSLVILNAASEVRNLLCVDEGKQILRFAQDDTHSNVSN